MFVVVVVVFAISFAIAVQFCRRCCSRRCRHRRQPLDFFFISFAAFASLSFHVTCLSLQFARTNADMDMRTYGHICDIKQTADKFSVKIKREKMN